MKALCSKTEDEGEILQLRCEMEALELLGALWRQFAVGDWTRDRRRAGRCSAEKGIGGEKEGGSIGYEDR